MSARHTPLTRSRTAVVGVGSLALVVLGPLASSAMALPAPSGVTVAPTAAVAQLVPVDVLPTGAVPAPVAGPITGAVDALGAPLPAAPGPAPSPSPSPSPTGVVPPLPTPLPQPAPTAPQPTTPPTAPPVVPPVTDGQAPVAPGGAPVAPAAAGGGTAVVEGAPAAGGPAAGAPAAGAPAAGGSDVAALPAGNFGELSPRGLDAAAASAPLLPGLAGPLTFDSPQLAGPQLAGPQAAPSTVDLALNPAAPSPASLPGLVVILATVAVGSAAAAHVGVLQNRQAARIPA